MLQPLPIDAMLPEIVRSVRRAGAVVVVAPPGAGKTTRVPPALLAEGGAGSGRLILLQPRRIAARAAAARVASERGWKLGREVGYQVRFESCCSRETRLLVVTEGILTRQLQDNPFLEGVGAVVLDEFHERSIHADLALAMLREIRRSREDLIIAVMSATLDPKPIAGFLGGCPVVVSEGRPFPVDIRYLEKPERAGAGAGRIGADLPELAARAVRDAWDQSAGHVLVFLPGIGEIRRAGEALQGFAGASGARIAPLHGSLSLDEQNAALLPSETRKIVLATNVAETSLTLDGVDCVIDGGYARILRHDARHGIDRLELSRISRYSADQRAGRAGRQGPGKAFRLWTRFEQERLAEAEAPEIRRIDLAATVLDLRAWGVRDPAAFQWFEAPDGAALRRAEELLLRLGAIDGPGGSLTEAGRAMRLLPVHPRLSRMLAAAHRAGVLEEGAALAALIEERDIVPMQSGGRDGPRPSSSAGGPSDLLHRLDLLEAAEQAGFRRERLGGLDVDAAAARAAARTRDALIRSAREALGPGGRRPAGAGEHALLRVLLAGYPDRVCRRRSPGSPRALMAGGRGVALSPRSQVRDAELFLAIELDQGPPGQILQEARVHIASAVERAWIEEDLPGSVEEKVDTAFDAASGRVRATAAVCFDGLPLEEPRDRRPAPELAEKLLAEAARGLAPELFLADEAAGGLARRVACLREWMPQLGLPALDAAELGEALASACAGKTSIAELRKLDFLELLRGRLPFQQLRAIDAHAPEAIQVPSGSSIRLAYEAGKPPVLAVRLQELFGLAETPRVAGGSVPVLLHLLGPNFRPVQVTQDLRSFWNNTYIQVRKDLRARYPRHAWPEDPWTAQPQRRPGKPPRR